MPTFPVAGPVPVVIDVPFGNLHVIASDREDVVVTVLPADPSKSGAVRAANETRVERDGDGVSIVYPGSWKQYVLPFSAGGAVVTIELPTGSDLRGKAGTLFAEGRLGGVDLTLNGGEARLEEASRLDLKVTAGSVVVGRITGPTQIKASAGAVRVAEIVGDGTIRASNGPTSVGAVTGSLEIVGAHAEIAVDRVRGDLCVRSANAGIRVAHVEQGSVRLTTAYGGIEVGVPEGTAAWLDLTTEHGTVRNQLTPTEGPVADEFTAEIRASSGYGDVLVRRP
ncbi:DUF4097 family beta strand repeat-containing protein [Cellulomonas wangsupingiae]|uniref:DUF4097 family beta strand repeat-containing protein n=1 Tax=Cellulomonas wangsupingiae TaxID=2968085 RepID=UPI001D0E4054|nr:DUF4097 family beta strand repeat-containing protein [Cellulomonas wangsupingiae]MCM0638753.1 DUF4097 family beta strand repeat-containing protein [Cellulomonas wangsupingiae]